MIGPAIGKPATAALVAAMAIMILMPGFALPAPVEADNLDGTRAVMWDFGQPGDYILRNATLAPGSVRLSKHEMSWVQDSHASFNTSWDDYNINLLPGGGIVLEVNATTQLLKNGGFAGPMDGNAYNWTTEESGDGVVYNGQHDTGGMADNGDCWTSWFWDYSDTDSYAHSAWVNQTVTVPSVPLSMDLSVFHNFTTNNPSVSPGSNAMLMVHSEVTGMTHVLDGTGWVNTTYDNYRYLGSNDTAIFQEAGNYTFSLFTQSDSSGAVETTLTEVENFWDNASMQFTSYKDSGRYISGVFNAGSFAMWKSISWEELLPHGTDIEFYVRSGNSSVPTDSIWSEWRGPLTEANGSALDCPRGQYIQYRAELGTGFTNVTPILRSTNITYDLYHLEGTVETVDFTPANLVRWGFFRHAEDRNGQTVHFQYSTDSGATWSDIPFENDLRSVPISDGRIRFRALLRTADTVSTPELFWMEMEYVSLSPAFTLEPVWSMGGTPPGEMARLLVHFNNTAPGTSSIAWLNVYLDDRLEYIANSTGTLPAFRNYIPDSSPGVQRYVLADMPMGHNVLWVDARVRPGTVDGDILQSTVTLEYLGPLENRIESLLSAVTLRVNGPAITATLSAINASADVGDEIRYLMRINNTGMGAASDVWVNCTPDDRLQLERTNWTFHDIPPGSTLAFEMNATMKDTVAQGSAVPMKLSVEYSDGTGHVFGAETNIAPVTAQLRSRLSIQVATQTDSALSGDIILMTVHFNNTGYGTAESARFIFTVPEGLEYVSSSEECLFTMNRCYWEVFDVGPGSHSFTLTLRAGKMATAEFTTDEYFVSMQVVDPVDGLGPVTESDRSTMAISRVYTFWEQIYWPWSGMGILLCSMAAVLGLWHFFKPIPPSIHDIFVLYKDGRLITHRKSPEVRESELDGDLVGAMLTAVQQFISDSLSTGKADRIRKLEFGDRELYLERGENINMALVYSGTMNRKLQRRVQELTSAIESEHPGLVNWDGRMNQFSDVEPLIDEIISEWQDN